MIPKLVKRLFLALGLAMLWLGFLYSYELNKQESAVVEADKKQAARHFETYTLSNDAYSEEAIEELKFNNPGNGDRALIYPLGDFPESDEVEPEYINTAGFTEEFDELEVSAESTEAPFPLILVFGGAGFLLIGFLTLRKETQKKQAF